MDPVSHAIIGTALSKFTGNGIGLSTAANIGIVIGSVFPDIDIALKKWGDYVYLKNHRVFTHSFPGLLISAGLISFVIKLLIPASDLLSIFIYTLGGCLSHTLFDILNSYGAKLLWPFYNKKLALNLLVITDPILLLILTGYIFTGGITAYLFIGILIFYILSRASTRYFLTKELKKMYAPLCKASVIPSMLGLFEWHFVLEKDEYTIVGEKNVISGKISIIDRLQKTQSHMLKEVLKSPVGKFFTDFTPLFHISLDTIGNIKRYTFTDLRYYVKNNFFHHAILELDENNSIVKSSFNPYSINRNSVIPSKCKSRSKGSLYKVAAKNGP